VKQNRCIISGIDISHLPFEYNEDSRECQSIKNKLLETIITLHNQGVDEFYTNCNYGFPLWGGEIVTGLMMYNDIRLYAVYPYENQPYKYAPNWADRLYKVHELCTDVIPMYIEHNIDNSMEFLRDEEMLIQKADDYMLADCGRLLFCGDGQGDYLYDKAVEQGLEITTLNAN